MISLPEFLDASPTAFHAAEEIARELRKRGWNELDEGDSAMIRLMRAHWVD